MPGSPSAAAVVATAALVFTPSSPPSATATAIAAVPSATSGSSQTSSPPPEPAPPSPVPTPTLQATPTPIPPSALGMPFVPVVGFWSTETSISMDDLRAAASGGSASYPRVVVSAEDADALEALLGTRGLDAGTVADVEAAVKEGDLGLLRATDVSPAGPRAGNRWSLTLWQRSSGRHRRLAVARRSQVRPAVGSVRNLDAGRGGRHHA